MANENYSATSTELLTPPATSGQTPVLSLANTMTKPAVVTSAAPAAKTTQNVAELAIATTPKIPVPTYGQTITDSQGRVGVAKFDPNTGLALTVPTPGAGITATSAPIIAEETKTTADVTKQWTEDAVVKAEYDKSQQEITDRIAALEARRVQEETAINAQFEEKTRQTKEAQTGEKGTFSSTLARIGGYLGGSVSGTAALINLNQQHQYQLNDLESKRASAVQAAKNAVSDKQFDLARLKSSEAKSYADDITKSKQDFFNNAMKITQEARQQDQYQRTAIKDKLDNLAYLSPDKISDETKTEIDTFYGTPGFTDNYVAVTNQAAQAKTQKDVMDARKATLDFLQGIPAGQKISMPDGTEFTGMGKAGDVSTFMLKDKSGRNILVTYNKLTGETGYSDTGITGSVSSSGSSASNVPPVVKDNATAIFQSSLEAAKDPKTGQYDPDIYLKLRNQLKESQYPQLVSYMDKLFLDKSNGFFNDSAISRMRKQGIFYGDTTLPDATATATDLNGDIQNDNN